jgi:hypothetical protein
MQSIRGVHPDLALLKTGLPDSGHTQMEKRYTQTLSLSGHLECLAQN